MDIRHLLCESISKFDVHQPHIKPKDQHSSLYSHSKSPQRVCSSFSSPSLSSNNSVHEDIAPSSHRRRAFSDIGETRAFVYTNHRVRSRSANSPPTRTPWTPYEDDLLRYGYSQGFSWAAVSSNYLPHRSRGCCWGRFKTLQSKNLVDQTCFLNRPWKPVQFEHKIKNYPS
ncbi:hypothetical protein BY458DRAFT_516464 [Sporodiniella umbellata]|nr:hypothetical protein BY458DRAFT_516464 [Sporodiniella umbellata]